MRKVGPGVLAALALITLGGRLAASEAPPSSCPGRVGVEATAAPVEGREGTFRLRSTARNLATGAVLAAPQIFFRAGEEATAKSELPGGGGEIRWVIFFEKAGAKAAYRVEVRCKGELASSQALEIQLSN